MDYITPCFSLDQVDWAGDILTQSAASSADRDRALEIINNWRAAHYFPLNTFYHRLRNQARNLDSASLSSQRIKRLSSIRSKLHRMQHRKLTLSTMQDIGGCRAVVQSTRKVQELVDRYLSSDLRHDLERNNDYIDQPKRSGYRGVHLVYRYKSDRKTTYNGQRIKIQIRSPIQHAWATAVEVFGTMLKQSLKASRGEPEWLRFFALMGSAIAMKEGTTVVPQTPVKIKEFRRELAELTSRLRVLQRLEALKAAGRARQIPQVKDSDYFLLVLNSTTGQLTIHGYNKKQQQDMLQHLERLERDAEQHPEIDPVAVSVDSLNELQRAYPNYYLDTAQFVKAVKEAVKK